jgi:hypothetical protein
MSSTSNIKRLRFERAIVEEEPAGKCRVRVILEQAGTTFEGDATDSADGIGPLKAAASAALMAVQLAAADRFTCSLSDLDHVNALGKDLIAVLVDTRFQSRDVEIFGSCPIAGSTIDCAVKAALNATNRMFELALREE